MARSVKVAVVVFFSALFALVAADVPAREGDWIVRFLHACAARAAASCARLRIIPLPRQLTAASLADRHGQLLRCA